jgi:excisionase family DNA binding protein
VTADSRTPRWASVVQTAEYLGVHRSTVRRWIASGDLRAYRTGRRLLRLDLNQVDEHVANGKLPNARSGQVA